MKKVGMVQIYSKKSSGTAISGGATYMQQAKDALSLEFDFELINLEARYFKNRRYLKFFESFYYLLKLRGEKDVWIRGFYETLFLSKKRTKGKNLSVAMHVDSLKFPLLAKLPIFLAEKFFFYGQLKKFDGIVTMSEYWKDYFLKRGYPNVYKIYCGFDLNNFNISEQEIIDFKKKYELEGKPIIYLGNCQKAKGVVESYRALEGLDAYLVTSSRRQANIPTLNFDLNYRDYLRLLKASSLVVTMSKFKEGWCMTAHESMLCKTPVIGSGLGGMRELLEGGNQIICSDFKNLRKKVEYLLSRPEDRKKMGENGYNFAKNFTEERFKKSWLDLIKKIA